jgi:hypothetical protein
LLSRHLSPPNVREITKKNFINKDWLKRVLKNEGEWVPKSQRESLPLGTMQIG